MTKPRARRPFFATGALMVIATTIAFAAAPVGVEGLELAAAQDREPPVACPDAPGARPRVIDGERAMAPIRLALVVLSTEQAPAPLIESARSDCKAVLRCNPTRTGCSATSKGAYNLPAAECVGRASQRLAETGSTSQRQENYKSAYCAYDASVLLMTARGEPDRTALGNAHEGRANALMGLRAMVSPETDEAARYLTAAMSSYESAIRSDSTPSRRLALGRAYLRVGDPKASTQIRAAAQAQPGPETAHALVELAEYQRQHDTGPRDILNLLALAAQPGRNASLVEGARGIAYFMLGENDKARAAFSRVIDDSTIPDATSSGVNYRDEAHYYLSVMAAQTAHSFADWDDVVRLAGLARGGSSAYRRQACLAAIGRGGATLVSAQGAGVCGMGADTQGQLLSGMHHLRRAQYLNGASRRTNRNAQRAYADVIKEADAAFTQGLQQLGSENPSLAWPLVGSSELGMRDMLLFGQFIGRGCSESAIGVQIDEAAKARARPLYQRYNAYECAAPAERN